MKNRRKPKVNPTVSENNTNTKAGEGESNKEDTTDEVKEEDTADSEYRLGYPNKDKLPNTLEKEEVKQNRNRAASSVRPSYYYSSKLW